MKEFGAILPFEIENWAVATSGGIPNDSQEGE